MSTIDLVRWMHCSLNKVLETCFNSLRKKLKPRSTTPKTYKGKGKVSKTATIISGSFGSVLQVLQQFFSSQSLKLLPM